uniref:CCHC-type domain-containing protein n=1 Tax=Tanacetum cinerariifolium TaxID=118510 RepID=A0A699INE5_TANCI|nr:hypothetical protein [Tanacetum cinerariifolium]
MVVIDDHDMIDTGEGSIPRDMIETGEGLIPTDVLDVGEGSNTRAYEEIDVSNNESYRNDLDFAPTPNGTPYWRPDLPKDEKPKLGDIFNTFDDGYNMYKVYSEKGRFNIRKSGIKRYKGKVTHGYVLCNRAGKVRSKFDINTLKEADAEDEEKDGNTKRKRKIVSRVIHCLAKIGLKVIHGTECYKLFDFVENHNHPLMNENNMDLSRARRQPHFSDYIYIHRAALSNIGPTLAHRLKVALMGGYDKVRGTPSDYKNFKRAVNLFIVDKDAQMIVDKMINRQLHVLEFSFEHHVLHDELVKTYINLHWKKEALPTHLLKKKHIYGPCIEETDRLVAEVHATIEDCVGLLRSNTEKLTQFLTTVKEMKKKLEVEMQSSNYDNNKEALYADLLGVTVPEQVIIKNPKKSSNKGSKRRKSETEEVKAKKKPRTTRKVPFKHRICSKCGGKGHKRRKCTGKMLWKKMKSMMLMKSMKVMKW